MSNCNFTWRNKEFNIWCACGKKEGHAQDKNDNGLHLCYCEWPGLFPEGVRIVVRSQEQKKVG